MIMTLAYGKTTPTSYSDPEVQQVNRCLTTLGKMVKPGAYLVDTYPILQRVFHRISPALSADLDTQIYSRIPQPGAQVAPGGAVTVQGAARPRPRENGERCDPHRNLRSSSL
jgi:hypothetical protein